MNDLEKKLEMAKQDFEKALNEARVANESLKQILAELKKEDPYVPNVQPRI